MKATNEHKRFSLSFLCFFVAGFYSFTHAQSPAVTKVDPPSWWARHTIRPVRLLVHGVGLHGARVRALNEEMRAWEVSVNEKGTYLFVDLEISPSLPPGQYPLL